MKSALSALGVSLVALCGCASTPTNTPVAAAPLASATAEAPPSATPAEAEQAAAPEPPKPTAAEAWAEKSVRNESASPSRPSDGTSADPMAVGDAMEAEASTNIVFTPARQLRPKTVRDLQDGQELAQKTETSDEALKKLVVRLGKPNWVENGRTNVWVVRDTTHCYRLVLEANGTIETEKVVADEVRMLSALSQQNLCTGVVAKGVPGLKH
jgi:hypothetical protein